MEDGKVERNDPRFRDTAYVTISTVSLSTCRSICRSCNIDASIHATYTMLPPELLLEILDRYPARDAQVLTLASLISARPRCFVVHGLEATGKSSITRLVLERLDVRHAIVDSKECVTGRQLLEKAVAAAADAVDGTAARCETLAALQVQLSALLEEKELVLLFDGIDGQREAPPTLIPALARIAESVSMVHVMPVACR